MVGHDAQPHVRFLIGSVANTGQLGCPIENRPHLINLVEVLNALLEEGHALEAHARINVLVGQFAEDLKFRLGGSRATEILHKHEVPDFDVAILVGDRTTLDAVLGPAVKVDLRTGARWAWLSGRPIVVFLAPALNARIGQSSGLLPERYCFVVILVNGDPQIFFRETQATIAL